MSNPKIEAVLANGKVILSLSDYEFIIAQLRARDDLIESYKTIIATQDQLLQAQEKNQPAK